MDEGCRFGVQECGGMSLPFAGIMRCLNFLPDGFLLLSRRIGLCGYLPFSSLRSWGRYLP